MKQESEQVPAEIPCPCCARNVVTELSQRPASFPFCSDRCRTVDLGSWADERYSIADTAEAHLESGE